MGADIEKPGGVQHHHLYAGQGIMHGIGRRRGTRPLAWREVGVFPPAAHRRFQGSQHFPGSTAGELVHSIQLAPQWTRDLGRHREISPGLGEDSIESATRIFIPRLEYQHNATTYPDMVNTKPLDHQIIYCCTPFFLLSSAITQISTKSLDRLN